MATNNSTTVGSPGTKDDVWIPTSCYMCYNACSILVHRVDGVITKIEGNPDSPHNHQRICAKGNAGIMALYNPHRITKPLRRTNPEKGIGVDPGWEEISWDEARAVIVEKLNKIRETDPRRLLFLSFDTQGFGTVGKAWASAFGTPNVSSGSAGWFCGNGLHPIAWSCHGTFYMEPDFDHTNYVLNFGSQAGVPTLHVNPMGVGVKLADARQQRGTRLVVIDPFCSTAASKADEWVPIRPGTDAAMALAMVNVLLNEEGVYDRQFLIHDTNAAYLVGEDGYYVRDDDGHALIWDEDSGSAKPFDSEGVSPALTGSYTVAGAAARPAFDLLKEHVAQYTPESVEPITTVPAETTRRLAKEFGAAASIGSTITLQGKVLPHRPAVVDFSKGAIAHKHGLMNGWACQMLNTIVGAVDVPGGHLGVSGSGPGWEPVVGPDGILVTAPRVAIYNVPYPPKKPVRPSTMELTELFPHAVYSRPLLVEGMLNPEKYGLDYEIDMIIQCRTNMMMSAADPVKLGEMFAKVPFMLSFATLMEETTEFADIVLPDAHVLERLDPLPNRLQGWILSGEEDWYWTVRQPVVDPPEGVPHWTAFLLELAKDMGMADDLFRTFNHYLNLVDPFKLQPGVDYSYEDVVDALYKSQFDAEHGLDWFLEHGILKQPRPIEQAYQRPFVKARVPLYLEHLKRQGEQVKQLTEEMGIGDWDVSDYRPLPDWRPCGPYELKDPDFDLFAINAKETLHSFTYTVSSAWLNELSGFYPDSRTVFMNPDTAQRKGLHDRDDVLVRTSEGKEVRGILGLFEGVHPEVVVVRGVRGHWASDRKKYLDDNGIHFNSLLNYDLKNIDMASAAFDCCLRVSVTKTV